MNATVTFDGAAPEGTINLGIGQPSADLLPVDLIRQASDAFFQTAQSIEFNYGVLQGDERFLNSLAVFLSSGYQSPVSADSLFVTGGNSQALDLVATVFSQAGDTVFVEEPSYFLAFQIFRDHGLNIVGIPIDNDGLRIDILEEQLQRHTPAFLYTIPSYHNPGGQCMSGARRRRLLELSEQYDFLIVADEVYQLLHYYDAPPAAMGTLGNANKIVSLGSFSKILAPGMRLGWIQTSPALRLQISSNGFVNSGGSINHYSSHIVRLALDLGLQEQHITNLRRAYRSRVDTMDDALKQYFDGIAEWTRPDGGYFFWLTFDKTVDTTPLRSKARELETGFQPGAVFSSCNALHNRLRLSFAHYSEPDIVKGISRLRPLFS